MPPSTPRLSQHHRKPRCATRARIRQRRAQGQFERRIDLHDGIGASARPPRRDFLHCRVRRAGMGFSMPLLALALEARGVDSSVIGLNAAMTFLGVILVAPAVPWAARVLGAKRLMLGCLTAG